MVKFMESLTGKLSFICKAVPQGHTFLHQLYDAFAGLKQHYHIDITGKVKKDLVIWEYFLTLFNMWTVSYTNKQYSCWLLLVCGKAFYCCARAVQE